MIGALPRSQGASGPSVDARRQLDAAIAQSDHPVLQLLRLYRDLGMRDALEVRGADELSAWLIQRFCGAIGRLGKSIPRTTEGKNFQRKGMHDERRTRTGRRPTGASAVSARIGTLGGLRGGGLTNRARLQAINDSRIDRAKYPIFHLDGYDPKGPGMQGENDVWRSKVRQGDGRAQQIMSQAELIKWWQILKLRDRDWEALHAFDAHAARRVGDNPLEVGPQAWPEQLVTTPETRVHGGEMQIDRADAIRGWRVWAVQGSDLVAPILTRMAPGISDLDWEPGENTASSRHCDPALRDVEHPTQEGMCLCGIRAVQSLTVLQRYNRAMSSHGSVAQVVAEVDVWGRVLGPARGDDWPYTVRGQHAQIVGPIHLTRRVARRADDLAARYDVPVLIGSDEIEYVDRKAEQ